MSALLVDRIAQHVRTVDGDNMLSPSALGIEIVTFLRGQGLTLDETDENAIEDFVYDTVRGAGVGQPKLVGAGRLAELIVAEFDLDEEG